MSQPLFADRTSAGERLAREIVGQGWVRPVVYALPRGGVPVAVPVAAALGAPLDLLLVRKIGAPRQSELAAASIVDGERPDIIYNGDVMRQAGLTPASLEGRAHEQLREIERRRSLYLRDRHPIPAQDRTAILVDDGLATGASMKAAITAIRRRHPLRIVVATPVASPEALRDIEALADQVICLAAPRDFRAVGYFYDDFHQLDDSEVIGLLAGAEAGARPPGRDQP